MAFEAKDYAISDILNKSVFDIPRNQRRYVWKKPHWQDLHEDIVFSITETKPHFVGSIVLEGEGKKDGLSYYTIIDGQQRLTTITIVLLAIMKHFHENDMTDDFLGTISYLQSKNNSNQDITILNSEYHVSLSSLIRNMIALKDKRIRAFPWHLLLRQIHYLRQKTSVLAMLSDFFTQQSEMTCSKLITYKSACEKSEMQC